MRILILAFVLLLMATGCEGEPDPPSEKEPGPQAETTAPTVEDVPEPQGPIVIVPGAIASLPDPVSEEELAASFPALRSLDPLTRKQVLAMVNGVPAPCVPCAGQSIGRCSMEARPECANIPGLVERVIELFRRGEPAERVRASLVYTDSWLPLPDDRRPLLNADAPVQVQAWLEPAGPFLEPAVLVMEKLPADKVGLVLRYLPDSTQPSSEALARAAIAAEEQGLVLPFLRAVVQWRNQSREALRAGKDPFAEGGIDAIVQQLASQGLDRARFDAALRSPATDQRLREDAALAPTIGVRSIPTWFVNGYRLRGAQSDLALGRLIGLELEVRDMAPQPGTPTP